jgi:hypothetical protein
MDALEKLIPLIERQEMVVFIDPGVDLYKPDRTVEVAGQLAVL